MGLRRTLLALSRGYRGHRPRLLDEVAGAVGQVGGAAVVALLERPVGLVEQLFGAVQPRRGFGSRGF